MPEPTDHRAEAEDWLRTAEEFEVHLDQAGQIEALVSIRQALIGIGHALLAGLLEPVEWESPPYTRSDHDETAHEAARTRIEERFGMTPEGPQEPE